MPRIFFDRQVNDLIISGRAGLFPTIVMSPRTYDLLNVQEKIFPMKTLGNLDVTYTFSTVRLSENDSHLPHEGFFFTLTPLVS